MLRERIRTWIESYDRNGYLNGSILVAGNGHRIVNEGFGMANREHGVANTPSTKFRIDSFRFSASGGAEHVEYTDDVGKKRRLFKVGS